MIGMSFSSFLTLLVISLIGAAVVHYAIRYRFLEGTDDFLAKWIVGWVAAWLSAPVLGNWFAGVEIAGVYVIPAFIGAFAGAFVTAAVWKVRAVAHQPRVIEVHKTQQAA